jgi:hypothetical protein
VVGEVYDCLFVCSGLVVNYEFVVICQGIYNGDVECTGETFLAIGRDVVELYAVGSEHLSIPNTGMIASGATVEVVRTIVDSQLILLAIEGELTMLDAVAITTDECAQEGFGRCYNLVDRVVTLHYVAQLAVAVGHHDGEQCTAIVCESYLITQLVGEDVEVRFLTIDIFLKIGLLQARYIVRITYV